MKRNNQGFTYIILLAIFVPVAIAVTFVAKNLTEKYGPLGTIPSELEERQISQSLFKELFEKGKEPLTSVITPEASPKPISTTGPTQQVPFVKVGSIEGQIKAGYYSQPLSGVIITAIRDNFQTTTTSGANGWFSFKNLQVGEYTLKFNHSEYSFSDYKQAVGEGKNVLSRNPHGFLKDPQPLSISGQTFSDNNGNNTKDEGEESLKNLLTLYSKVGDSWSVNKNIFTDDQGNFSLQISDIGPYRLEPTSQTFYSKPNPVEFIVDGYGGSKNYSFPYCPISSQVGFKIYIFNDKNEDSIQDQGEEYIHYQYAQITNTSTGKTWKVAVPPEGDEEKPVDYGSYTIKLVPQDESWAYWYTITKGEISLVVTNTSPMTTVTLGVHKH